MRMGGYSRGREARVKSDPAEGDGKTLDCRLFSGYPGRARLDLAGRFFLMKLVSLLSASRIVPEMKAATQWDAMDELVGHLVTSGHLPGEKTEGVLAALHEREEQVSTGIGHGVAIPHAYCDELQEAVAVFGRSGEGLEFESCDNAPVHYLILMLVPRDQAQTHLQTLAAIAGLFSKGEVRERLREVGTGEEIYKVLLDYEG